MKKIFSNAEIILKLSIISSYLSLFLIIFILNMDLKVIHYELSIYSSIPLFWILIILTSIFVVTLSIYGIYKNNLSYFWHLFSILIICNFIIMILPILRGYYLIGSNDPYSHYLLMKEIISSGFFSNNIYPFTHIFGAQIIELTLIEPNLVAMLIPPIFSVLFIIFSYFLTKEISQEKDYASIAAILVSIPLYSQFHVAIYPQMVGTFMFPIAFYCYFKSDTNINFKFAFIIFLIIFPFIHPVPSLILILALLAAEITKSLYNTKNFLDKFNTNYVLIAAITWATWWTSQSVFYGITRVFDWVAADSKAVPRMAEVAPIFGLSRETWIILALKMYGNIMIFILFTSITAYIIIKHFFQRKDETKDYFVLLSIFIASNICYLIIFLSSGFISVGRLLGANIGLWSLPILSSLSIIRFKQSKAKLIIITIIIILTLMISDLNIYRSPWVLQPNWHFTYSDYYAANWKQKYPTTLQDIQDFGYLKTCGYSSLWFPMGVSALEQNKFATNQGYVFIPPHFGYEIHPTLRQSLPIDTYLYYGELRQKLTSMDSDIRNIPISLGGIWAPSGFNKQDINKFQIDPSLNTIYTNGDDKALFIKYC